MTRDINPFGLRMPPELKTALEDSARENGRSLNTEIVKRLIESFEWEKVDPMTDERYAAGFDDMAERMKRAEEMIVALDAIVNSRKPKGTKRK